MSTFSSLKFMGSLNPQNLNKDTCLLEDQFMDYSHPLVAAAARTLTKGYSDPWDKISGIFNFVRDKITYNFAPNLAGPEDFKASRIIKARQGFCHQKAILSAALLRAVEIPSALYFQDIIDYPLLKSRYKEYIPSGILYYHGLTAVFVDGTWFRLDGTLDSALCRRRGYRLSIVKHGRETLLPDTTESGKKHFEILKEHGYLEFYDPAFSAYIFKNKEAWKKWRRFVHKEHLSM